MFAFIAIALRNAGTGIAVQHGWYLYPRLDTSAEHAPLDEFVRLTRDLYIAGGEVGFWQGTYRDPSSPEYAAARAAIEAREPLMVEVLYGDHEGGQRVITRFAMMPRSEGDGWIASAGRHWQIDRDDPR